MRTVDPGVHFAALARSVRDGSVSNANRHPLFEAVEALAAAYGTPAFGEQYAALLMLVQQEPAIREAMQTHLLALNCAMH
jgi:hypothetical protein